MANLKAKLDAAMNRAALGTINGTPTNAEKVAQNKEKVDANKKKVATNAMKVAQNKEKVAANAMKVLVNSDVEKGKPNTIVKKGDVTSKYNNKGNLVEKYLGKEDNNINNKVTISPKSKYTSESGVVKRYTKDPKTGNNIGTSIDTTGYSFGKKKFNVISSESTKKGTIPSKYKVKSIPSKDIPKQLKEMQKMKGEQ
jgi:hypothetical protein